MNNEPESLFNQMSSQQTLRKKRKLNEQQRHQATKREKHRMIKLNKAYTQLRLILPVENKCKLSRIETLRTALNYIYLLHQLLEIDTNNSIPIYK